MAEQWFKAVMLTCWVKYSSQQDVLELLNLLPLKHLCIGTIEETKTEKPHFHVVATFTSSIRLTTLKNLCKSWHIERVKSAKSISYSLKEGCYYNDFELEQRTKEDIYSDMIDDMSILEWSDIIKKYPKFIMSHYDNLLKMYNEINKKDVL